MADDPQPFNIADTPEGTLATLLGLTATGQLAKMTKPDDAGAVLPGGMAETSSGQLVFRIPIKQVGDTIHGLQVLTGSFAASTSIDDTISWSRSFAETPTLVGIGRGGTNYGFMFAVSVGNFGATVRKVDPNNPANRLGGALAWLAVGRYTEAAPA